MTTFYVDPNAAVNGSGSLASPYNTWAGVTLTANNTYLQRRGTTYIGASVRPASQTSNAATPLTIGAYYNADGSDDTTKTRPIINHNGGTNGVGAVFVDTCAYVVVQDIAGTNSHGSLGGGVTVRRSQNVIVQRCAGYENDYGVIVYQDQASGTSTCTDITIRDNDCYDNVAAGIAWWVCSVSDAIIRRMKIHGNTVYGNGTGKGLGGLLGVSSVPCGGIMSFTANKASIGTAGYINYDIRCDRNTVSDNNGYGINIEGWALGTTGSSCSRNTVTGSGYSGDVDSHSLWVGNSSAVLIEENHVHHNFANTGASSGSGVGIFIDYNSSSTSGGYSCIVRRNKIHDQFRGSTTASALAAGAGIIVLYNDNTVVESNLIYNCRNGVSIGNGSATDGTLIYSNTVTDCDDGGISVLPLGTGTVLKNNVVRGAVTGLFVNTTSTTGYAETYNSVSNCTTAKANGTASARTATTLHATDLITDPLLTADYRPKSGSPLLGAGTHLGYRRDIEGKQRQNPPDIGAYDRATLRTA